MTDELSDRKIVFVIITVCGVWSSHHAISFPHSPQRRPDPPLLTDAEMRPKFRTMGCGEKPGLDSDSRLATTKPVGFPPPQLRQAVQPLVGGIWGSLFPFPKSPLSFLFWESSLLGALRSTEHFGIHKMVIY